MIALVFPCTHHVLHYYDMRIYNIYIHTCMRSVTGCVLVLISVINVVHTCRYGWLAVDNVLLCSHTHMHTYTQTLTAAPNITFNPEDVLAIVNDEIDISCSAQATPTPSITWETGNGTMITRESNFSILNSISGVVSTSILSFIVAAGEAGSRGNGSLFRCVASNVVDMRVESLLAELTVAGDMCVHAWKHALTCSVYIHTHTHTHTGVPGSPAPVIVSEELVNSRNASVSWQEPFSLINISHYIIRVVQLSSNEMRVLNVSANSLQFVVTDLQPNRPHMMYVSTVNRAGVGEETASGMFTMLEDGKSRIWS